MRTIEQYIVFSAIGLTALLLSGCAFYTESRDSTRVSVVGLSRYAWNSLEQTNASMSVATSVGMPGLAVGCSREFFGLSLGYTIRDNLVWLNSPSNLQAQLNGREIAPQKSRRWAVGRVSFVLPGTNHSARFRGSAMAGVTAGTDSNRPRFTLGRHSAQYGSIDDDVFVEMNGGPFGWPFFDYPATDTRITKNPSD